MVVMIQLWLQGNLMAKINFELTHKENTTAQSLRKEAQDDLKTERVSNGLGFRASWEPLGLVNKLLEAYFIAILEFVHDGDKSVAELMDIRRQLLGRRQVLPTVPQLLDSVLVKGTFPDGTKLITVHDPVSSENGNLDLALHGSFLPIPSLEKFPIIEGDTIPGELILINGHILLNFGRKAVILKVTNDGYSPIQVGSHYHFIELGDAKSVTLVRIGGNQVIRWGNAIVDNFVNDANVKTVMESVHARGFGNSTDTNGSPLAYRITREAYANIYGPTVGDKIRLGDTDLFAEVEKDFVVYGDECVFGGGKVIRDGMGPASRHSASNCLDTVITNALIIDYTDIGIKGGCISAIGKAGYPDAMNGVFSNMIIGLAYEAIASGITTMGLKLHEDRGTTPAVIYNCLTVVDQYDI
ncbi:urease isoform X1 [Tanacetum coccineum]